MATVAVPPLFRCPISLELMKDPVTLCTGITYERSSIQKWIADGNFTCPATMQSIQSTELVPNHTLKRLIESFRSSDKVVLPELDLQSVRRLRGMYTSSSLIRELKYLRKPIKNRSLSAELREELVHSLMLVLESGSLEVTQEAIAICSMVLILPKEVDHRLMHAISKIFFFGSTESRIHAAVIVERLSDDWDLKIQFGSNQQVLQGLSEMVSEKSSVKAGLSAMRSLLAVRRNRTKLVGLGTVHRIIELLPDLDSRSCTELALSVLALLCRSAEGRDSFAAHDLGMFAVVKKMFRVSTAATEFAVTIIWSLCKYSADESVRGKAVDASAFERLLLLLHVDCSPVTKQQVCDLLKLLRQVYNEDPCIIASPDQAIPALVPIYPRF